MPIFFRQTSTENPASYQVSLEKEGDFERRDSIKGLLSGLRRLDFLDSVIDIASLVVVALRPLRNALKRSLNNSKKVKQFQAGFRMLPPELLATILGFAVDDPRDLLKIGRVNRQLRSIVFGPAPACKLWRGELSVDLFFSNPALFQQCLKLSGQHPLHVRATGTWNYPTLFNEVMAANRNRIGCLRLSDRDSPRFPWVPTANLPGLTCADLELNNAVHHEHWKLYASNLKHLTVSYTPDTTDLFEIVRAQELLNLDLHLCNAFVGIRKALTHSTCASLVELKIVLLKLGWGSGLFDELDQPPTAAGSQALQFHQLQKLELEVHRSIGITTYQALVDLMRSMRLPKLIESRITFTVVPFAPQVNLGDMIPVVSGRLAILHVVIKVEDSHSPLNWDLASILPRVPSLYQLQIETNHGGFFHAIETPAEVQHIRHLYVARSPLVTLAHLAPFFQNAKTDIVIDNCTRIPAEEGNGRFTVYDA